MPRYRPRLIIIKKFKYVFMREQILNRIILVIDEESDDEIEYCALKEALLCVTYTALCHTCYFFRERTYRQGIIHCNPNVLCEWEKIVSGLKDNDEEFLQKIRTDREHFHLLVGLLKGHPIFNATANNQQINQQINSRKHFSVELHLLVTLRYFGSMGTASNRISIKDGLHIGKGTIDLYLERMVTAILALETDALFWPGPAERKEISSRIKAEHHFPKVVGVIDGTHLGLLMKPMLHPEDYFSRKHVYALGCNIIVDDYKRIRNIVLGWPATVHDNRIWKNCTVSKNRDQHFSANEYLLGDSAFNNSPVMVASYKKAPLQGGLPPDQEWFNDLLASPRVKVENGIGIWKGRFPYLRMISLQIKGKISMIRIIRYVKATAILHNLLINHLVDEDWVQPEDDGDMNDEDVFLSDIEAMEESCTRREQVHNYLDHHLN
jgi:hypothetical protein